MTDTSLIALLKDDRAVFANILANMRLSPYTSHLELSRIAKRIEALNAHIARLESPELVEVVAKATFNGAAEDYETAVARGNKYGGCTPEVAIARKNAQAAIDAVMGRG